MPEIVDSLREYENTTRAILALEAGGRIINMTVSEPEYGIVSITTQDISYPQQMVQTILAMLRERRNGIAAELAEMGVTGLGETPRAGPTPARKRATK